MPTIGFVGPGRLGWPMVERLATAGHDLTVHARRQEVRAAVEAMGVAATEDLTEVGKAADLVIVCVYSDPQLQEVAGPLLDAMRPGTVLASHVTGTILTLRQLAQGARERGIEIVDSPLSGHADDIRAGSLTVMLGGEQAARSAVEQAMSAYASPIIHTGPLGSALGIKLVNNTLLAANLQLLAEAIEVAASLGTEEQTMLRVLTTSSGGSYASKAAAGCGSLEGFTDGAGPFLRKDVNAVRVQAAELGLDLGLLDEIVSRGRLPLS
jgi:3-hydroxyisobutyrate dehydrogenase-like beta-hydroxyacid dehydrogenase